MIRAAAARGMLALLALAGATECRRGGAIDAATPRAAAVASLDGRWRAGPMLDPAGKTPPDADALRHALDDADLPREGETVTIHGGRMCIADQPCQTVAWTATRLDRVEGGARLAGDLGLPPATRAFTGDAGNPRVALTVIAPADGRVLAVFALCPAPTATDCRNGYQPWSPAGT